MFSLFVWVKFQKKLNFCIDILMMPRNGDSKVMQPFKLLCRLPTTIKKRNHSSKFTLRSFYIVPIKTEQLNTSSKCRGAVQNNCLRSLLNIYKHQSNNGNTIRSKSKLQINDNTAELRELKNSQKMWRIQLFQRKLIQQKQ